MAVSKNEVVNDHKRPDRPQGDERVWYRGWEAFWDDLADSYMGTGFRAYIGGCDIDARYVAAGSWNDLLDEIDDEEDN